VTELLTSPNERARHFTAAQRFDPDVMGFTDEGLRLRYHDTGIQMPGMITGPIFRLTKAGVDRIFENTVDASLCEARNALGDFNPAPPRAELQLPNLRHVYDSNFGGGFSPPK
jgi:hypothetical protein